MPSQAYLSHIGHKSLISDQAQHEIAQHFDQLARSFTPIPPLQRLRNFLVKKPVFSSAIADPRSIYLYGPIGSGKTMLMDLFYAQITHAKIRFHFHDFMQEIHKRLKSLRRAANKGNEISVLSALLAKEYRLLCLDEMQINDITDAMIIGRLFEGLLARGMIIVTTSNLTPSALYKDGLNRELFLPFIALIEHQFKVIELVGARDYRLDRIKAWESFLTPLGTETSQHLQQIWFKLTDTEKGMPTSLAVLGRHFLIPQAAHSCARFHFSDLCARNVGSADYLALAQNFTTIFIEEIPVLGPEQRNEIKRFILLIDTLYDKRRRLVASSAHPPETITSTKRTDFARTISRLKEMQSASWWGAPIGASTGHQRQDIMT